MNTDAAYDAIIVGSGAGGSAAAYQLARAGLQVALLEKGDVLPRDGSTLNVEQVVHQGRFKSSEVWLDNRGRSFKPEEYCNLGGKTKWYGAALLRYGRHEFGADSAHACASWPIAYDDLAPYYEQAEQLLGVTAFAREPDLAAIVDKLQRKTPGWRVEPLALGLSPAILRNVEEARHFDGFASNANLKADAETAFLRRVKLLPNLRTFTNTNVVELIAEANDPTHICGVRIDNGPPLYAKAVLLAAGALHSPRLLQRHVEQHNLAGQSPAFDVIGRNLKLHLLTAMIAVSPSRKTDLIRKTSIFYNDALPHSSVQPLGFDGELIGTLVPKAIPRFLARRIGDRAYGFFLQTEDGAHRDNRVCGGANTIGSYPTFDYDAARTPAALREHEQLVKQFRDALTRAGMIAFSQRIGLAGTAHASGTLTAGNDLARSVVGADGRVHGMRSLYVIDGSILPRSSRVNPALTIYAWSLRVSAMLAASLNADRNDMNSVPTASVSTL